VNDLGPGRNIDDVLRTLDALQHIEKSGDVCPANWEKGRDAMEPSALGVRKYLKDFGRKLYPPASIEPAGGTRDIGCTSRAGETSHG
jgi:hypothetical protein